MTIPSYESILEKAVKLKYRSIGKFYGKKEWGYELGWITPNAKTVYMIYDDTSMDIFRLCKSGNYRCFGCWGECEWQICIGKDSEF